MTASIVARTQGAMGRLILNRPQVLNALTFEMLIELDHHLRAWASEPNVKVVVIEGAGDRAFCAGGDIQKLYSGGRAGNFDDGRLFFRTEYKLNALIANYPKPYVALMDRIVMGGGVGISVHGSHRIVTERTSLAMPECAIGLIPDVGSNYVLSRAPGHVGEYLALTGSHLGAADAIYSGLADGFVASDRLGLLLTALDRVGSADVVSQFVVSPGPSHLAAARSRIDYVFGQATLGEILHALELERADWATSARAAVQRNSPLALHCALLAVRRARTMSSVEDALRLEHRFAWRSLEEGDLVEGVRAALIDKDRAPRWRHQTIDAVKRDTIDAMLAPLGVDELCF